MPQSCPKCHHPNAQRLDHCTACGIVFARYEQMLQRRAQKAPLTKVPQREVPAPRSYRPR